MSITKRLRHHAEPADAPIGWPSSLMLEAADEIDRLDAEVARLTAGIKKYLDEGIQETSGPYGQSKNNRCEHNRFGFEVCEQCTDAYFEKLLK